MSRPEFVTVPIDRRRFLLIAGGAAAYLSLRPHLSWAQKLGRDDVPLQPWTLPAEAPTDVFALTRALVGAAILAPSNWNSQPWRFAVDPHPERPVIRVIADVQRALPATDPDRRWMMASLGAALENLLVAARAYALRPSVRYFPDRAAGVTASRNEVVAEVTWDAGEVRRDQAFFDAIPERRTNRNNYDGRGLFPENRARINAQVPDGLALHWIDEKHLMDEMSDVARDAARDLVRNPELQRECYAWTRQGDRDARERGDGVSTDALALGGPAKWFAGRYYDPQSWFLGLGAESAGKQARAQVRSSGALALLTTSQGNEAAWLEAGQTYERIALACTQVGISHHPMNESIQQPQFRDTLARLFRAGGEHPLMLLRMGHAGKPDPTPRRSFALVSSYRNS